MANIIYARSPFFVSRSAFYGQTVKLEIKVWAIGTTEPTSPTYILTKKQIKQAGGNVDFDISPFAREYFNHSTIPTVTENTTGIISNLLVNVKYRMLIGVIASSYTTLYAIDGYNTHENGYNYQDHTLLLSAGLEQTIYVEKGVNSGFFALNRFFGDALTVQYNTDSVLPLSGGTFTLLPLLKVGNYETGNKITIKRGSSIIHVLNIIPICESKYTPIICDFINRFGVWQRITFFKASSQTFDRKSTQLNLKPSALNYNVTDNVRKDFNLNGNQHVKVNTGFVPESYSEYIKQIMLSERILIDGKPAVIDTNSIQLQQHINDKLINYELDFTFAYNQLNYVL
jgi:hypothetical protein